MTSSICLLDYPKLPILGIEQCLKVFELALIPYKVICEQTGCTRMTLYKWRTGKSAPNRTSLDRVSMLAYRVLRAIKTKQLPNRDLTPDALAKTLLSGKPKLPHLSTYAPDQLLPKQWVK